MKILHSILVVHPKNFLMTEGGGGVASLLNTLCAQSSNLDSGRRQNHTTLSCLSSKSRPTVIAVFAGKMKETKKSQDTAKSALAAGHFFWARLNVGAALIFADP